MGKSSGFSEYNRNFKFTSLTIFLGLPENKVGKCIESIHILSCVGANGIFCRIKKTSVVGKVFKS